MQVNQYFLTLGISEGCFIFDFASLPLEVTHLTYHVHKVAVKHQPSSSSSLNTTKIKYILFQPINSHCDTTGMNIHLNNNQLERIGSELIIIIVYSANILEKNRAQ